MSGEKGALSCSTLGAPADTMPARHRAGTAARLLLAMLFTAAQVAPLGASGSRATPPFLPTARGHTLAAYPGARCLDGSPGLYYLVPGTEASRFLVFFEGGGFCTDFDDCAARSQGYLGASCASLSRANPPALGDDAEFAVAFGFTLDGAGLTAASGNISFCWTLPLARLHDRGCDNAAADRRVLLDRRDGQSTSSQLHKGAGAIL